MATFSAHGALSEFIRKPKNSTKSMNSLSEIALLSEFIENPESGLVSLNSLSHPTGLEARG